MQPNDQSKPLLQSQAGTKSKGMFCGQLGQGLEYTGLYVGK